jgi:hypothetical protein
VTNSAKGGHVITCVDEDTIKEYLERQAKLKNFLILLIAI